MDPTVAGVVLAAALLHAAWNALLRGGSGDPQVASTGLSATWAVLGWPVALALGPLPAGAVLPVCGSVAVHVVYFTLLTLAYRQGELSLVYPVARGVPPVLVALVSVAVFGEALGPLGAAGVGLVAGGVLLLGPAGRASGRAVAFALGSAACTAAYTVLDGVGVRASEAPFAYLAWLVALQGTVFTTGALWLGRRRLAAAVWDRRGTAVASGVLSALGYAAALWAMTHAPVVAVAALRETSVLFAAVLATVALGEPFGRRRALGAVLVALGAMGVRVG